MSSPGFPEGIISKKGGFPGDRSMLEIKYVRVEGNDGDLRIVGSGQTETISKGLHAKENVQYCWSSESWTGMERAIVQILPSQDPTISRPKTTRFYLCIRTPSPFPSSMPYSCPT